MATPTCWDQWYPEVARLARLKGAELIVYPTCIGGEPADPEFDTSESWQIVMRGHAVANSIYVAACNRVGVEDGPGASTASASSATRLGAKVAEAARGDEEVLLATLARSPLQAVRDTSQFLRDRRPDSYAGLLRRDLT